MIQVVKTKREVRAAVAVARAAGKSVGFVPTMGALHAGHARLIETAVAENAFTVLSIFVNPTQFGPAEDLDRYPRALEADTALASQLGADLVFAPTPAEVYPADSVTWVEVEQLTEGLCGARRPGHFRGVTTVCAKLFNIVRPDRAYFGRKDYQQLKVIERMVRDLDLPLEIKPVETVREADGLAMSSRNQYLSPEDRQAAPAIYQALQAGREMISQGAQVARDVSEQIRERLLASGRLRIDYIEIVDAATLEPLAMLGGEVAIAVAAYCGPTRLIDNITAEFPEERSSDCSCHDCNHCKEGGQE